MRKLATIAAMAALLVFAGVGFVQAKTFVIPHVLEVSGNTTQVGNTFDTTVFAVYQTGLGAAGTPSSATIQVFLFETDTGGPMVGANNQAVCNPSCNFTLSGTNRKEAIEFDTLISAQGGPNFGVKVGYSVMVVGGTDPNGVAFQGFVVNSHSSPFDLAAFGFAPQEILAAAN